MLEHVLYHLASVGAIDRHGCDSLISSLRSRDVSIYIATLMISFLFSFISEDASHTTNKETDARHDLQVSANVVAQMNQVLVEIKIKFRVEEERIRQEQDSLRKEREQFNLQMRQSHQQFHENYGSMHQRQSQEHCSSTLSLQTSNALAFVSPPPCSTPRFVGLTAPSAFTPVKKMISGTITSFENNKRKHEVDSCTDSSDAYEVASAAKKLKGSRK